MIQASFKQYDSVEEADVNEKVLGDASKVIGYSEYDRLIENMNGIGGSLYESFTDGYKSVSNLPVTVVLGYTDVMQKIINKEAKNIVTDVYLEFDTISSIAINIDSTVTQYPLINADYIMDHMFVKPLSLTISGTFSQRGIKAQNDYSSEILPIYSDISKRYVSYSGGVKYSLDNRLRQKQDLLESIMKRGLLCSLAIIDNGTEKYITRNNLAISALSFDQRNPTSMPFNISFTEVRFGKVSSVVFMKDPTDDSLPNIDGFTRTDFTDAMLDQSSVLVILIQLCYNQGLISEDYIKHLVDVTSKISSGTIDTSVSNVWRKISNIGMIQNVVSTVAFSLGVAWAVGGFLTAMTASSIAATVTGAALLATPIGWAAIGVGLLITGIGAIFASFVLKGKNKFRVEPFEYSNNSSELAATDERFVNFLTEATNQLETYETYIQVYSINKDIDQTCMLQIGNSFYSFIFKHNTAYTSNNDRIMLEIDKDLSMDSSRYNISGTNVIRSMSIVAPVSSMSDMKDKDSLLINDQFVTNKYFVYLCIDTKKLANAAKETEAQKMIDNGEYSSVIVGQNPDGSSVVQVNDKNAKYTYEQLQQMALDEVSSDFYSDLTNYQVFVSQISIERDFTESLQALLTSTFLKS